MFPDCPFDKNSDTLSLINNENINKSVEGRLSNELSEIPKFALLEQTKKIQKNRKELYKTELCANWSNSRTCKYGEKCHFSHGYEDLRPRKRVENFKSHPCCDPAKYGNYKCLYEKRCNYAHPGEAIRRPCSEPYYDEDYYAQLKKEYKSTEFPFGIYI